VELLYTKKQKNKNKTTTYILGSLNLVHVSLDLLLLLKDSVFQSRFSVKVLITILHGPAKETI